jgi:hypothetical protein
MTRDGRKICTFLLDLGLIELAPHPKLVKADGKTPLDGYRITDAGRMMLKGKQ